MRYWAHVRRPYDKDYKAVSSHYCPHMMAYRFLFDDVLGNVEADHYYKHSGEVYRHTCSAHDWVTVFLSDEVLGNVEVTSNTSIVTVLVYCHYCSH